VGNWKTLTTDGGTPQIRMHNVQNQLTSIDSGLVTPTYDANGNTTKDEQSVRYHYDAWNRLTDETVGPLDFVFSYDALGRRVQGPGALGQDFYYSANWQVLEEQTAGVMKAQYVWSAVYVDALVARDLGSGSRLYVQQDANWNVTAVVVLGGIIGNVQERIAYDPYGKPTFYDTNWNPVADSLNWVYLHQGGRYDVNSGLYNFRNRDLSPTLGRWMQEDPIGYKAGDSNLYRYVNDNPINRLDPRGTDFPFKNYATDCSFSLRTNAALSCACPCPWRGTGDKADQARKEGQKFANDLTDPNQGGPDRNPDNHALRHCVASGLLALWTSCACSSCLGTIREAVKYACYGNSRDDIDRALSNNQKGREAAGCSGGNRFGEKANQGSPSATEEQIKKTCKELWEAHKLDTRDVPPQEEDDN
jgi:RHS repeat-associated protein